MIIQKMLHERPDLQDMLFRRGFLLSKQSLDEKLNDFPFYGNWSCRKIGGDNYNALTHNKTGFASAIVNGTEFFIFGHCYNPFTMEWREQQQLQRIGESFGTAEFWERVSEITGVFALGWIEPSGDVHFVADPSGMQSLYYGVVNGNLMVTSHPQIIGDLYDLKMDDFVKELVAYRWYKRVMGCYLPADLSPFKEVKRVVPNIEYTFHASTMTVTHRRFYPTKAVVECQSPEDYQSVIEQCGDILHNGFELLLKKWQHPAVSLTGGIDSNGTFAAANGHYSEIETFSYLSAFKETIDVDAAKKIAAAFNVKHTVFNIPQTTETLPDFDIVKAIIEHNNGYVISHLDNEVRKRVYLEKNLPYDVEVKSWVNETVRGYWYKHYGRKSFPALSAKLFRNLYKIFITNRSLAHKVDKVFDQYIADFEYRDIPAGYLPADMHYNEVTWGSWGGMNISEMKLYSDITIVYNNRRYLDLMMRVPLEKRISDECHVDMKRYLNPKLWEMGIRVVNMAETASRARKANLLFTLNQILP